MEQIDRRQFLQAGVGVAMLGALGTARENAAPAEAAQSPAPQSPLVLWYRRPAGEWLEALPLGNGRLGAMVFGGVPSETLQLNEGTLWAGGPHDYSNPAGRAALPEIRRLVFAGKYGEAQGQADAHFLGLPRSQAPYQTVGSLHLQCPAPAAVSGYERQLDLETAIARTAYVADGVRFTREVFASFPDQVVALRLTADKPGQIVFTAAYATPQKAQAATEGTHTLALHGVSGDAGETPGAVKFCALARIQNEGGSAQAGPDSLTVTGADAVTILISMATSYRNYKDAGGDATQAAQGHLHAAQGKTYAQLRQAHVADHRRLFSRFDLDLGQSEAAQQPTDERIRAFGTAPDPGLPALYCQYGRYLLIASSRPGGQPANLQGVWNDSLAPPWGSKYTVNINTEMNYWPAAPGGLAECYPPLFDMIADLAVTGAETARVQYGARGWVCHHNTDAWRGTAPVDGAFYGTWPTGGAWLCKNFWDHYQFTGDKAALARHYPLMQGAAQFFLDTLMEEPTHHWLVTNPSLSPEHEHSPGVSLCDGPTMDMQIIRDLFDEVAEASEILQWDSAFRAEVKAARARLAPMQVGAQGQLQEWLEDWDAVAPDPQHRHTSHLYGLYPSAQISRRGTPALFAAARKSLETRGDESTGWAEAWRINLWARLEDGDRAFKLLSNLLTPGHTAPNLFDLHPPFQIDGNFGGAAGILEMLAQSQGGELHLLPALPAAWPQGQVRGLHARGGFEVALTWAGGKPTTLTIHSRLGSPCFIRLGEQVTHLPTKAGHTYTLNGELSLVSEKRA